jgi:hypothetical protein
VLFEPHLARIRAREPRVVVVVAAALDTAVADVGAKCLLQ